MKYHLGCGSKYLEGYLNVDFPKSEHTVNNSVKADRYEDVLCMLYDPCDEIRTHHFFEHFNFSDSLVLLYKWTQALNIKGKLLIDVPDIEALCKAFLRGTVISRFKVIRYLYGSHEASWAYHVNGWSEDTLSLTLGVLGYRIDKVSKYGDILSNFPNCGISIEAILENKLDKEKLKVALINILGEYRNGNTDFENKLQLYLKEQFLNKIK